MKKAIILSAFVGCLLLTNVNAQTIPFPQASPTTSISQNFATSKIELSYSRPSAKGRKVFGEVVPFGKFWRTGANGATLITFGEDVKINGTEVKAGKYGLITFPGETEWTIVITKDLNVNNVEAYKQENDAARFTVKSEKLNDYIETFTIDLNNMRNDECNLFLKWEHTAVRLNIVSFYDDRLSKQILDIMGKDTRPYYGAANYYFDNNKDLGQALAWVNKAIEANPKAYWVWYLKAKIQKAQGNYAAALESSMQSLNLAKADKDDAYTRNNENLQIEIKALQAEAPTKGKKK